jgi:uncharacterized iron-regulated membrane protein
MGIVAFLHRWTGGLIGLLLAALGLSGAILAHKDLWIGIDGSRDIRPATLESNSQLIEKLTLNGAEVPDYILLASDNFGLHRLSYKNDGGAYANHAGQIVEKWDSVWDRPEVWLFDFHHHFFAGDLGELAAGILALIGLAFVITGALLWWQTRRTFALRLWPARMSRSAIIRHHRDLGIIMSPFLFLSCLTGAMLTLKPVTAILLSPFSSAAEMLSAAKPPSETGGIWTENFNWRPVLTTVEQRFPDAEVRIIIMPKKPGDLIAVRAKQPSEWLPNGRTTLWFDPGTGRLIEARDALALPMGAQVFNAVYPLHAGKVGGVTWRVFTTLSGIALFVLGTLATWSFWFKARRPR